MRFTVFSVSALPDVTTARRLYGLDDLDDESVCKVLFHRRKRQAGADEALRWDQRHVGALALLHHDDARVRIELPDGGDEAALLRAYFDAGAAAPRLVSWDGTAVALPLLHFRALQLRVAHAAYWQAMAATPDRHLDLQTWLTPPGGDRPGLDETARTLGLPGMRGLDDETVLAAWLAGRPGDVRAHAALGVLNAYLVALRVFELAGEITVHQAGQATDSLRAALAQWDHPRLTAFAGAWGGT